MHTILAKLNKVSFQPKINKIIRFFSLTLILAMGFLPVISQQNGEVIVFSENWDNTYSLQPWSPNYGEGWFNTSPINELIPVDGRGKSLKMNTVPGDVGSSSGIGNYRIYLDSLYKELYLSFEYYLSPNFSYGFTGSNGGGKLFGGFSGGNMFDIPRTEIDTSDGWGLAMIFQNGYYYTYPYLWNSWYSYGGFPGGNQLAQLVRGEWREITLRLKINDPYKENGIIEAYDNGRLVFKSDRIQMTSPTHPEWLIDAIYLNHFIGGSDPSTSEQYAIFDNLVAWYYPKGSSMYREGASESGRTLYAPRVTNYHPPVPNKFTPAAYTEASGKITSHCGFDMPIVHPDDFETSTIEVSGASKIWINVSEFSYDGGVTYSGYKQILNIYSGKGTNKTLVSTFMAGYFTSVPFQIEIPGNTATIEWQAGEGLGRGFTLTYSSDGTGSGKNFACGKYIASQRGANNATTTIPPVKPPIATPASPSNLQVISVTSNSINIKWNDNSDVETAFEVERMGPTDNIRKTIRVGANSTTYSDIGLASNSSYTYWIRAYNTTGGFSAYTSPVQATTQGPAIPLNAPSGLTSTGFTEKSISIQWNDNSSNENGFLITRTLALDPDSVVNIYVDANTTVFTDDSLASNTTYIYTVKAVNNTGTSSSSNKNVAATLSVTETKRVKDGLIAYYNFGYDPDYIVRDLSGFGSPLNLKILKPSAVIWNENNRVQITANTAIVSATVANKLTTEIKKTGEITMECWIRPFQPDLASSSRVISLGLNDSEVGFVLDQSFSNAANENSLNYLVRVQTESTVKSGYPEITPLTEIGYLNMQHVVYVRDTLGNETIYMNGKKAVEGFRPNSFNTWVNTFYLRLGNENDLTRPWRGTFYLLAIYNKALTAGEINKNYNLGPCDNIKSDGQEYTINVFPNPVIDLANIEVLPVNIQDYIPLTTIRVLDMYGKLYYQTNLFNPDEGYKTTLDFNGFAKGIYFLQVISGSEKKSSKLIVQ